MDKNEVKIQFQFGITPTTKQRIADLSERWTMSQAQIIRIAIRQFLENLEAGDASTYHLVKKYKER